MKQERREWTVNIPSSRVPSLWISSRQIVLFCPCGCAVWELISALVCCLMYHLLLLLQHMCACCACVLARGRGHMPGQGQCWTHIKQKPWQKPVLFPQRSLDKFSRANLERMAAGGGVAALCYYIAMSLLVHAPSLRGSGGLVLVVSSRSTLRKSKAESKLIRPRCVGTAGPAGPSYPKP